MHNFKRVLVSILSTLIIAAGLSAIAIFPLMDPTPELRNDSQIRKQLAGTLDCVIVGASTGLNGCDTGILDEELNYNSYNLCSQSMTLPACNFFLRKELNRNPIEKVFIVVSADTLRRNEQAEHASGSYIGLERLESFRERIEYIHECIEPHDYFDTFAQLMVDGIGKWGMRVMHINKFSIDPKLKGFLPAEESSVILTAAEAIQQKNSVTVSPDFYPENIDQLVKLIRLGKEHGADVIVITAPIPDAVLWKQDGLDDIHKKIEAIVTENNCKYYDFNLLKDRYTLFNDTNSYKNEGHLSANGAASFTKALCDIISQADEIDVSDCFYDDYDEMKSESPYNK